MLHQTLWMLFWAAVKDILSTFVAALTHITFTTVFETSLLPLDESFWIKYNVTSYCCILCHWAFSAMKVLLVFLPNYHLFFSLWSHTVLWPHLGNQAQSKQPMKGTRNPMLLTYVWRYEGESVPQIFMRQDLSALWIRKKNRFHINFRGEMSFLKAQLIFHFSVRAIPKGITLH